MGCRAFSDQIDGVDTSKNMGASRLSPSRKPAMLSIPTNGDHKRKRDREDPGAHVSVGTEDISDTGMTNNKNKQLPTVRVPGPPMSLNDDRNVQHQLDQAGKSNFEDSSTNNKPRREQSREELNRETAYRGSTSRLRKHLGKTNLVLAQGAGPTTYGNPRATGLSVRYLAHRRTITRAC
jgi:hypothetical protein